VTKEKKQKGVRGTAENATGKHPNGSERRVRTELALTYPTENTKKGRRRGADKEREVESQVKKTNREVRGSALKERQFRHTVGGNERKKKGGTEKKGIRISYGTEDPKAVHTESKELIKRGGDQRTRGTRRKKSKRGEGEFNEARPPRPKSRANQKDIEQVLSGVTVERGRKIKGPGTK